jgi:hypothetical protein
MKLTPETGGAFLLGSLFMLLLVTMAEYWQAGQ